MVSNKRLNYLRHVSSSPSDLYFYPIKEGNILGENTPLASWVIESGRGRKKIRVNKRGKKRGR
jgi:hypothetical protein